MLTIVGLLLLTVYAAVYARNHSSAQSLEGLNLRKAGIIITALGVYFDIIWLAAALFGDTSSGRLTVWPAFSGGHNMDLWLAALTLVGVPLIFSGRQRSKKEQ